MIKATIYLFFLRGFGTFLNFIISIFISRFYGATAIAHFTTFINWQNFISEVLFGGFKNYTIRSVVISNIQKKDSYNIILISIFIFVCSLFLMLFIYIFKNFFLLFIPDKILSSITYGSSYHLIFYLIFSSTSLCIIRLCSGGLIGLNKSILGTITENTLLPSFFIFFIIFYFHSYSDKHYQNFFDTYLFSIITVSIISLIAWKLVSSPDKNFSFDLTDLKVLKNPSILLLQFSDIFGRAYALLPLIILPFFVSNIEIGYFSIVLRLSFFSNMVLITLSSHFNSFFAKAYEVNDIKSLRLYFQKSRLLYILYNIPIFIIFIFFGKSIIALFGQVPESVYNYLILLSFGQLLSSIFGLSGQFLFMANKESHYLFIMILTLLFSILSSLFLCSLFSVYGVIISILVSNFFRNFLCYHFLRKNVLNY